MTGPKESMATTAIIPPHHCLSSFHHHWHCCHPYHGWYHTRCPVTNVEFQQVGDRGNDERSLLADTSDIKMLTS